MFFERKKHPNHRSTKTMSRKQSPITRLLPLKTRNQIKKILVYIGGGANPLWTANPALAAKMFPMRPRNNEYAVLGRGGAAYGNVETDPDGVPIPPVELRIDESSPEFFLTSGKEDVETMWRILAENGCDVPEQSRILEFGCSGARQLRYLAPRLDRGEVWGVDLSSEHIFWIQQHLDKRYRVLSCSSDAHLPFRDSYFDFVYAGSVFTHLDDLADAWFLELSRVVRNGGLFYLTVFDESSIKCLQDRRDASPLAQLVLDSESCRQFLEREGRSFSVGRSIHSYVFYDSQWLMTHLSNWFEVVALVPGAFAGIQSALVLRNKL
jgi:SAM-dependent methyltransferase